MSLANYSSIALAVGLSVTISGCASAPPMAEQANAVQAAREIKCEQQGTKRGTAAFYSCTANYEQVDRMQATNQSNQAIQSGMIGAGAALTGLSVPLDVSNGYKVYRFKYVWSDVEYVGVMAQEVRAITPEAVSAGADGYLRVDYALLGLRMVTFKEWQKGHL